MSDDVEMKSDEETSAVHVSEHSAGDKAPALTEDLSQAVHETLKQRVRADEWGEIGSEKSLKLDIDESDARANQKGYVATLYQAISRAYKEARGSHVEAATAAAVDKLEVILSREYSRKPDSDVTQQAAAFQAHYVGDADAKFRRYLERCCVAYWFHQTEYTAPYLAITQSSGFGKSRIMYNLAVETATRTSTNAEESTRGAQPMAVLYVCARDVKWSSGYPAATPRLRDWFFPQGLKTTGSAKKNLAEKVIGDRLVEAFEYACEHRGSVGAEWLKLFTMEGADAAVVSNLSSGHVDEPS